jgi:hypothetical protein
LSLTGHPPTVPFSELDFVILHRPERTEMAHICDPPTDSLTYTQSTVTDRRTAVGADNSETVHGTTLRP